MTTSLPTYPILPADDQTNPKGLTDMTNLLQLFYIARTQPATIEAICSLYVVITHLILAPRGHETYTAYMQLASTYTKTTYTPARVNNELCSFAAYQYSIGNITYRELYYYRQLRWLIENR